ncbi:hypothetical protein B5X24_HaOG215152 [Helicoverpa armigera]|nr:hypothetical protein B5X24_HaOG215152 [Helicoverpa armigera]
MLFAFISALKDDNNRHIKSAQRTKCASLSGKCVGKIAEKNFRSKRVKRSVMNSGSSPCPDGYIWHYYKCWRCDKYEEITGNQC